MISTFKQFWASLRDPDFGQTIISGSFKSALWYWTKILLFVCIIPTIILMFVLTYLTPQLPRFVQNSVPDGFIGMADGNLQTSLTETWKQDYDGVTITVDPFSNPDEVTDFPVGLTVLKDRMIFKDDENTTTQSFSDFPNFRLTKTEVFEYVSRNLTNIWLISLVATFILFVIISSTIWAYNFVSFFSLGLFYLILSKIMHKSLPYMNLVKLAVYATAISFVFSILFGILPSGYSFLVSMGILIFFGHRWLKPMTSDLSSLKLH